MHVLCDVVVEKNKCANLYPVDKMRVSPRHRFADIVGRYIRRCISISINVF